MKALAIQVGAAVVAGLVLSILLGFVVAHVDGAGVTRVLRDLSIIILAIFSLIMAAVWGGIYFGAAWAIGRFGGKATGGVHWVRIKTLWVEDRVGVGMERFVARPFARATRTVVTGTSFVKHLFTGPEPTEDVGHEVSRWKTFSNRLRGRAFAPPSSLEPRERNQRDMQPGPGISA